MGIQQILKPYLHPIKANIYTCLHKTNKYIEMSKYLPMHLISSSAGNNHIAKTIKSETPAAIGKIGSVELSAIIHYMQGKTPKNIKTWDRCLQHLCVNAGVHPCSEESLAVFFEEYTAALRQLDLLGIWYNEGEAGVAKHFCKKSVFSPYRCLEPYYHNMPWSAAIKEKTVLVMSPFAETIKTQHSRRELVWSKHPEVLPEFDLRTIKVPFSDAVVKSPYASWKVCLDDLRKQMDSIDFDVALIGAGAYSLPLCAHAKSLGKTGIHLGGSTQILFGIFGSRWINHPIISGFFNEHWCSPSAEESPSACTLVEGGCYW